MRILLTGTTGHIGQALLQTLGPDHLVMVVNRRPSGHEPEIVCEFDFLRAEDVKAFRPEVIIHGASLVGEQAFPWSTYERINVSATRCLLECAAECRARHFVLLSTGGIYRPSLNPIAESSTLEPRGYYAKSKRLAEQVAAQYGERFAVQIVRLFFPYGPGQRPDRLIPRLISHVKDGIAVQLNDEEGRPQINPVYVSDVIDALCRLLRVGKSLTVNLGGCQAISVRALAEEIGALLGRDPTFITPHDAAGHSDLVGDISLLRTLTSWEPQVPLTVGLSRMIAVSAPGEGIRIGSVTS